MSLISLPGVMIGMYIVMQKCIYVWMSRGWREKMCCCCHPPLFFFFLRKASSAPFNACTQKSFEQTGYQVHYFRGLSLTSLICKPSCILRAFLYFIHMNKQRAQSRPTQSNVTVNLLHYTFTHEIEVVAVPASLCLHLLIHDIIPHFFCLHF